MAALYTMVNEYQQLADLIEAAVDPDELQALADTMEGLKGEIDAKILACACVIRNVEAQSAGVQAELDRLAKRKQTMSNNVRSLKSYMLRAMKAADVAKVSDAMNTVTVQLNPATVVIDDESKLPSAMIRERIERAPDKKAIGDAIKAGVEVPGAHIERTEGIRLR